MGLYIALKFFHMKFHHVSVHFMIKSKFSKCTEKDGFRSWVTIIMDKKLTKYTKTWTPQNMQTCPTVQTIFDNTIKHKHTL